MNKRLMTTLVIAVLALGLAGLAQEKPVAPDKPGRAQMTPGRAPMQGGLDLQLTPEQKAKLEAHRKAVAEQQKAFAEQMKTVREDMQALRKDGAAPDPAKHEALIDKMFKLRADQAKLSIRNQAERNKIFTPEQLEKMKNRRGMMMAPGLGGMQGRQGMAGIRGMMMGRRAGLAGRAMGRMMDRNRMLLRERIDRIRDLRRRAIRRIREE